MGVKGRKASPFRAGMDNPLIENFFLKPKHLSSGCPPPVNFLNEERRPTPQYREGASKKLKQ